VELGKCCHLSKNIHIEYIFVHICIRVQRIYTFGTGSFMRPGLQPTM
jgi:hypothetical protein